MKKILLFAIAALLCVPTFAQQYLTLENSILGAYKLQPERVRGLNWLPEDDEFVFQNTDQNGTIRLMAREVGDEEAEAFLSLDDLQPKFEAAGISALKRLPAYRWDGDDKMIFLHDNRLLRVDVGDREVEVLTRYAEDASVVEFAGEAVAFVKKNNLYVTTPVIKQRQITKDGGKGIRNGDATHRYEFGISKGIFWSPNQQKVAFYRTDESMVAEYPIMDLTKKPAGPNTIRYPFAGAPSHHVTLGVHDLAKNKTVFLNTGGDPEHYLTNISWTPDGKFILVAELNRDQNKLSYNRYNATTGKLDKTLFTENQDKYVHPQHVATSIPDSDGEFLWQSARDGYNHLYHYAADGTLIRQLTSGDYNITEFKGFDPRTRQAFVSITTNQGIGRHLMKIDLKKGSSEVMNADENGTHVTMVAPSGNYYIDVYSSVEIPAITSVRSMKDGKRLVTLKEADDPFGSYDMSKIELKTIKAADGKTDLWTRTILPPNFDPNKQYPVLVYVYNGPGVQLIRDVYGAQASGWMFAAAAEGMIVFSVDGRGSANRSLAFEQAAFRRLGTVELDDQLKGVEYLKSLPYVDGDKMAVHGWSYGGFMTVGLMSRKPGTFKVGVAGGPVIDWSLYEVMYTERYMDTPEKNPDGFDTANLLNYVNQLEGDLLLIHGTSDDVVVWQHSLAYIEKAIDEGKQLDYFVYPNHPHNVRGVDRVHLMRKVLDYVQEKMDLK